MNNASLALIDEHLRGIRKQAGLDRPTADDRYRKLVEQFDFVRLVKGLVERDSSGNRVGLSGAERELCTEAVRGLPGPDGVLNQFAPVVPWECFAKFAKRDVSTAASGGGYLVDGAVDPVAQILRPFSIVVGAGVEVRSGLRATLTIPKETTAPTWYWLPTELTTITESTPVLGQVVLDPKMGGTLLDVSRLLRLQGTTGTSDFISSALLRTAGQGIDAAVINGTGASGQPTGILNTSGIGTQTGGTFALSHVLAARETVGLANANDAALTWVAHPTTRKLLAAREKVSTSGRLIWESDAIDNRPAYVTTGCPTATLLLGDFSQATLGFFGPGLQVEATQQNTASAFQAGITTLRVLVGVDLGVRQVSAFHSTTSIT
jgi:HK97 family phage major capsid protein